MKVLFMTNVPSPYRVDFFNELGRKCDLTVLFESKSAKSRDAAWKPRNLSNFKAVFLNGIKVGEAEAVCFDMFKYLSRKKFDIIIVGMYSSPTGMLAIEYMRLRKIPFIISSDGGLIKKDSGLKHMIKERYIGAASAWLSTGSATTDYLCYYGAKREKVYTYPFTSVKETDILKKSVDGQQKEIIRRKLGISEERVVLSVGQFIYRKGYDLLLKAWKCVDKKIGLYIVGGLVTQEYSELKKQYGLENVHFIQFMPKKELSNYYMAADVFVLPTREDIWGLVINEASAFGLPIITTDCCVAGTEIIKHGETGYILSLEEIQQINKYILNAFKLNKEDVLHTARNYTIERMASVHIEVFEQWLKDRSGI